MARRMPIATAMTIVCTDFTRNRPKQIIAPRDLAGCGKSRHFGKTVMKRARNENSGLIKSVGYEDAKGDELGSERHRPTFSAACSHVRFQGFRRNYSFPQRRKVPARRSAQPETGPEDAG